MTGTRSGAMQVWANLTAGVLRRDTQQGSQLQRRAPVAGRDSPTGLAQQGLTRPALQEPARAVQIRGVLRDGEALAGLQQRSQGIEFGQPGLVHREGARKSAA